MRPYVAAKNDASKSIAIGTKAKCRGKKPNKSKKKTKLKENTGHRWEGK